MEEKAVIEAVKKIEALYNQMAYDIGLYVRNSNIKYVDPFWKSNKRLYNKVNKLLNELNAQTKIIIEDATIKAWGLADTNIDTIVETYISKSKVTSIVDPLWLNRNATAMNSFINRSVDGLKLSGRIWKNSLGSRRMIEETIKAGILDGKSAAQQTKVLRQALKEPNKLFRRVRNPITNELELSTPAKNYSPGAGKYRSSYKNALRLTRTETKMAYQFAEFERIQQIPFVSGIKVNLSSQHPKLDICDHMQGDYPKNFTFLGWHPQCICFTTTLMLNDNDFKSYLDSGKISTNKYTKNIPSSAKNYVKVNKDTINNAKNTPYWVAQNQDILNKQTVL